jgi:antirestriction protein ArdC
VILHEVAHWTGAINRLNRVWLSTQGRLNLLADGQDLDAARNHEECVADIASKMLWHYLGLNANAFNETRHAQYLHLHGQGVDVKLAMQEAFQVVDFCDDLIKGTGQKKAA